MGNTRTNYHEKRADIRFPVNSAVTITLKPDHQTIKGTCSNISGSGLLIHTSNAVAEEQEVLIDIREGKIEFSAEALVVRCQEDNDGSFYIGVQVTNQLK